eukprot:gene7729-9059_t
MELKHYTAMGGTDQPKRVRMKEHADLSAVTLLIQNAGTGGLQLLVDNEKQWIDAPYLEDCILVNTGNYQWQLMSKHLY